MTAVGRSGWRGLDGEPAVQEGQGERKKTSSKERLATSADATERSNVEANASGQKGRGLGPSQISCFGHLGTQSLAGRVWRS